MRSVTFIPQAGFEFEQDGYPCVVERVDEVRRQVHFIRTYPSGKRYREQQGLDFWNGKQRIAGMASLRELGHR